MVTGEAAAMAAGEVAAMAAAVAAAAGEAAGVRQQPQCALRLCCGDAASGGLGSSHWNAMARIGGGARGKHSDWDWDWDVRSPTGWGSPTERYGTEQRPRVVIGWRGRGLSGGWGVKGGAEPETVSLRGLWGREASLPSRCGPGPCVRPPPTATAAAAALPLLPQLHLLLQRLNG